jgi:3-deoxy-D-manno-octulosonic acid (KDO) 8-phosphate synthase
MEIKCNNSDLKFSNNSDLVFFLGLNVLEDDINIIIETHPDVKMAKCDAESAYPLQNLASLVNHLVKIAKIVKNE